MMKVKSEKSSNVSDLEVVLSNRRFYIDEEGIPTVLEKLVKLLGMMQLLAIKNRTKGLRQQAVDGIKIIDMSSLPGKLYLKRREARENT